MDNYAKNDFTVARPKHISVATLVAQRLLNAHRKPTDRLLREDGEFGHRTLQAVYNFQLRNPPLRKRDRVGPKTFKALGLKEVISYEVTLQPQAKAGLCWSAAASMLLGGNLPQRKDAKTNDRGALLAEDANVASLGKDLNWDFFNATSKVEQFAAALERAPLWLGGERLNSKNEPDAIHALVVAGLYTYQWEPCRSTKRPCTPSQKTKQNMKLLKIFDPWPIGIGRIYFMEWGDSKLPGGDRFYPRWFLSPRQVWAPIEQK